MEFVSPAPVMQALQLLRRIEEGGCSGNPFHTLTERKYTHATRLDNTFGLPGGGAVRLPYLDGNTDLVQSCMNSCSAASQ